MTSVLGREFYARDTVSLARDLLGRVLVREWDGERLSGIIVETEAYGGAEDAASHAFRGPGRRNRSMFGPPGHAYVYRIYGIHHCLNLVGERDGRPGAVLIRALRPLEGLETMVRRRGRPASEASNGPGKLCRALAVDLGLDGVDLCAGVGLWVEAGEAGSVRGVLVGPRVGLGADEIARRRPWRFALQGEPSVSRPRPPGWKPLA